VVYLFMMSPKRAQSWALALTATASLMVALDALLAATALSTIRRDLQASLPTLEWTMNAYGLSFAVLLMTGAALGDGSGAVGSSCSGSVCSSRRRRCARWRQMSAG
jgi:MFS family permease